MSHSFRGLWASLWQRLAGAGTATEAAVVPTLSTVTVVPEPILPRATAAIPASTNPPVRQLAPPSLSPPPLPASPPVSQVLPLRLRPGRTFMLAARIQSSKALNPPKALSRMPTRPISATKPLPKRVSDADARTAKSYKRLAAPRVLPKVLKSAEIVRLAPRAAKTCELGAAIRALRAA